LSPVFATRLLRKLDRFVEARAASEAASFCWQRANRICCGGVPRKRAPRRRRHDLVRLPRRNGITPPLPASATNALLSLARPVVASSMTTLSILDDRIKAEGLIARVVDRVFGYDFFLSYSHGDGMRLPRRLKERLEQAGFRVFLDQTEYVAGADLRRETRRQVLKSKKIVVIGRAGALKSEWVRREVDAALLDGKIPVILNLNGAVEAAPEDAPLAVMVRERDWLRLAETLDDPDGEPTDRIISELVRGFNHTRQETKRQRIFAVAAAVLFITAGIATWQAVEAIQARTVAEAERDRAQRVLDQVIGAANRSVQSLSLRTKKERETSPVSPPPCDAAHFKVYDRLAETAFKDGDPEPELAALTSCLAVAEDRVTAEPAALDWRQGRAVLHQRIGDLYFHTARASEAEEHYRKAIALWRELASNPSVSPLAQRQLAVSLARLGDLELLLPETDSALALYQESVSILGQLATASASSPDRQRDLSVGYQQISDAFLKAGKPEDALIWVDKDLATYRTLPAVGNAEPGRQRDLASSYDRRAQALVLLGRNAEALDLYGKGTALLEAATAADDTQPTWQRDAAAMLENMGKLLRKMNQPERAVHSFRRALSIREGLAALEDPSWQIEVEAAYRRTSEFMLAVGQPDEAFETAEQYLFATSLAADVDNSKVRRISRALGTLCWSALNARNFPRAVWAGQRAADLAYKLDWVSLNYAHALMFSGEREKAKAIYLTVGSVSPEEATKLKEQIRKDFAELKQRGLVDGMMAEISTQLGM
jgi:tetratricopeptide (TPR) repeat protein